MKLKRGQSSKGFLPKINGKLCKQSNEMLDGKMRRSRSLRSLFLAASLLKKSNH